MSADRPTAHRITVTPATLRRAEALGFEPGDGDVLEWALSLLESDDPEGLANVAALMEAGHSDHCARRQVWGDGVCTCKADGSTAAVDALSLEAMNAEQARAQLDNGDDVDAATRRYLGEALGIADPDDTPPSLSDFHDAVVDARMGRDDMADRLATLRLRVAAVNKVLCSGADETTLRQAVTALCMTDAEEG